MVRRTRAVAQASALEKTRYIVDFDRLSWGQALQLYLITSYLYYELNRSLITDHAFDKLCQKVLAGWRTGVHPHKHLVMRSDLLAGTGYGLTGRYPSIVQGAAWAMLERHWEL